MGFYGCAVVRSYGYKALLSLGYWEYVNPKIS